MDWWRIDRDITRYVVWTKSNTRSKVFITTLFLLWWVFFAALIFFIYQYFVTQDQMYIAFMFMDVTWPMFWLFFAFLDAVEHQADLYFDSRGIPLRDNQITIVPRSVTPSVSVPLGEPDSTTPTDSVSSAHRCPSFGTPDPNVLIEELLSFMQEKQLGNYCTTAYPIRRLTAVNKPLEAIQGTSRQRQGAEFALHYAPKKSHCRSTADVKRGESNSDSSEKAQVHKTHSA